MATMSARYTVIDGEVIAQERGGVRHQLVPDPLGSTVALYDDSGTKTDTFSYWPYGESAARTGTANAKFKYVGNVGYYQDSANKNYVRARYIDGNKNIWITEDPIGFDSGDFNLYRYVLNNVATYIDPTGKIPAGYGRYCGPQTEVPVDECGKPLEGIDDLDRCCKKHDDCFAKHGCTAFNQIYRQPCRRCNLKLCWCLISQVGCTAFDLSWRCRIKKMAMNYACNPILIS